MTELVSIIIPVYNAQKHLRDCLFSVLKQTYSKLELIIVNDGSTDDSGEICEEFAEKDSRIKVIHKENGGSSSARNEGLVHAKGDYVYFVDSDDLVLESAVEKLLIKAKQADADVVIYSAYAFRNSPAERDTRFYSYKNNNHSGKGLDVLTQLLEQGDFHVPPWIFLVRRQYLLNLDLTFVEGIIYEDMIFTFVLFANARKIAQVDEYLYCRRQHQNSVTTATYKLLNFLSALKVYEDNRNYLLSHPQIANKQVKNFICRCAFNAIEIFNKLPREISLEHQGQYQELKKEILFHNAHDNMALKMRCCGKPMWFLYKLYEKTIVRLLG